MPRIAAFVIVVFWFVMTLLLVRNEVSPEASRLREIPIAHVLKVLYLHEQPSDLNIFNGPAIIGNVRIQPRLDKERGTKLIDIAGEMRLNMSPDPKEKQKVRFSWIGMLEMNDQFEMLESRWSITMLEPSYLRLDIRTPEGAKAAKYSLHTKGVEIGEGEIPMNESGLDTMLQQFGMGGQFSGLIDQGRKQAQAPVAIRARQSSLRYHGERTETFLITVEQNGQTMLEAQFSQLGQILEAKTVIGYTLRPESYTPEPVPARKHERK